MWNCFDDPELAKDIETRPRPFPLDDLTVQKDDQLAQRKLAFTLATTLKRGRDKQLSAWALDTINAEQFAIIVKDIGDDWLCKLYNYIVNINNCKNEITPVAN